MCLVQVTALDNVVLIIVVTEWHAALKDSDIVCLTDTPLCPCQTSLDVVVEEVM